MSIDFNISLHDSQMEIFNDAARFKVVAAGRRFGKSWLACVMMLYHGLQSTKVRSDGEEIDLQLEEIYYVAPNEAQARRIMWPLLKELGKDLIASKHENTATCVLINGRRISIKGADRPDSLRGVGLSFVVLDEYAFMKDEVWEKILMPTLARSEGGALFIGTPDGENHFYKLFADADRLEGWKAWTYSTLENPFIDKKEIALAKARLSDELFAQEFEASFEARKDAVFQRHWWKYSENEPMEGDYYIAVDMAGFTNVGTLTKKELKVRDEHAIAVVKASRTGWWIADIIHGRWDVREAALRIMKAYRDYKPRALGIEKGALQQAVMPYLDDEMRRLNVYFLPIELSHGNTKKHDRIQWALQGRAEKGRITLKPGDWNKVFVKQASQFPSSLAHDDLIDAVAYIDQLASVVYFDDEYELVNQDTDDIIGF